jgi:hypothetical protein
VFGERPRLAPFLAKSVLSGKLLRAEPLRSLAQLLIQRSAELQHHWCRYPRHKGGWIQSFEISEWKPHPFARGQFFLVFRGVQMAGKPGRSGGARPNSGPKPKERPKIDVPKTANPLEFLLAVMNHPNLDASLRIRAAITAARYKHAKVSEPGKKQQTTDEAQAAQIGTEWEDLLPDQVTRHKR